MIIQIIVNGLIGLILLIAISLPFVLIILIKEHRAMGRALNRNVISTEELKRLVDEV